MAKKAGEPDRFTTPLIEFIHILGWYSTNPRSPLSVALKCVGLLADVIESDQLGPDLTGILAYSRGNHPPGNQWEWAPDVEHYKLSEGKIIIPARLAEEDLARADTTLRSLSLVRERRGASKYRMFDSMWDWIYEAEGRYPVEQSDALIRLSVRTNYFFDKPEGPRPRRLVEEGMRHLVEAGDLYYGLVTCSQFREDGGGTCYEDLATNWSSLRFQTEHELWKRLGPDRRRKVRGLYWGQYLSPWHLDQLGGKEEFKEEFTAVRGVDLRYRFADLVTDYADAGLFVKTALYPMNYSVKGLDVPCGDLGAWLHTRFKAADLLL